MLLNSRDGFLVPVTSVPLISLYLQGELFQLEPPLIFVHPARKRLDAKT